MIVNKTMKLSFKKKFMLLQILIFLFISIVLIRDIFPAINICCVIIIVIPASDSTTCRVCPSLLIDNLILVHLLLMHLTLMHVIMVHLMLVHLILIRLR